MKVSILIPAYNSGKYIAETLESALGQSWPDKEIIVVDDGSTDDTVAVVRTFESRGVRVFTQPNSGACRARNRAFELSTGDYIQFLDADDLLDADKIKNQMRRIGPETADRILSGRYARFYEGQEFPPKPLAKGPLERSWDDPIAWLVKEWEGHGMGVTQIWLCSRKQIADAGGWNESLSVNQDGEFFCRVLLRSKGIVFCDDSMSYYRSGIPGSVSQRRSDDRKAQDLLKSIQLYEKNILPVEDSPRVRKALAVKYSTYVYGHYDSHPALASEAKARVHALGFAKLPLTGGENFRKMSRIIGFENSLKVRSLVRRFAK